MDCIYWHVLSNCHNLLWKWKLTMLMDQSTYRFYSCQNLIKTYFLDITRILKICLSIVWRCSFLKYILHCQPWMDGRAHFTFCLYLLPLTFFLQFNSKMFSQEIVLDSKEEWLITVPIKSWWKSYCRIASDESWYLFNRIHQWFDLLSNKPKETGRIQPNTESDHYHTLVRLQMDKSDGLPEAHHFHRLFEWRDWKDTDWS